MSIPSCGGQADWSRVDTCTNLLPENKPRYVMGVGYPEDLVVSVALGADMFDSVWPSRSAVSISMFRLTSADHLAIWGCYHVVWVIQYTACALRRRLFCNRSRMRLPVLQVHRRRRLEHHESIHQQRGVERDCWRSLVSMRELVKTLLTGIG